MEGITISSEAPETLDRSEPATIQVEDDLIVWTHEHEKYGKGLGLTATAKVGAISKTGAELNITLKNVSLIQPPLRLSQRPRTGNGSEIIDRLRANHHRRTVEVTDAMVSELWDVVRSDEVVRLERIRNFEEAHPTPEKLALIHDADEITKGFERRFAMVEARPGQAAFRMKLIQLYGRKCLVTGSKVEPLLQAAHIVPFSKDHSCRDDPTNGLLLRADIHVLFDRCLLAISPTDRTIIVAENLKNTSYRKFANLTVNHKANPYFIRRQFQEFERQNS